MELQRMATRLGRYELGAVLGVGGMGRVHAATLVGHGGFRKEVALKVLHEGSAGLQREARIAGLLRHENLVDVYDIGEQEGTWYCAMERCASSLSAHRPLPPRAVVEVGLAVCEALQYAHADLGLVHMDLKPDNLLLSREGTIKVADLGIARAEGFEEDHVARGTPGYMPPEQLNGEKVDARADVYALGVTLQRLASSDAEVDASTGDWLSTSTSAHPSSLDDTGPAGPTLAVADWLGPVLERCLAPAPDDRPDMAELARLLRALDVSGPGLREHVGLVDESPAEPKSPRTNVPRRADAFVGRERDVEAVLNRITRAGLVTLKGPAGIGKTRLAAVVGSEWHARHGAQAWFCELVEARSARELTAVVGRTLGVDLTRGDPVEQVGHALSGRGEVLVVLDNFEQLVDAAEVVACWREIAREARFLVTSRAALGLPDEEVHEVDLLTRDAAIELLLTRARERGAEVAGDPRLPDLAARLDGLPLALELAAGRLGVLSIDDVLERMDLGFLRAGADGRHATLQAALQWGWDLLDSQEQSAVVQLAVFVGGFDLAAAEAVLELPGAAAVEVVDGLLERSWLHARGERLGMLESIRAFARAQGTERAAELRHARWFADLPRRAGPKGSVAQVEVQVRELENLVAACRRAAEHGDAETALAAVTSAGRVFGMIGPADGAVELCERVRQLALSDPQRGRLLLVEAQARRDGEDFGAARASLLEALDLYAELGDELGRCRALGILAGLDRRQGDLAKCEEQLREALAIAQALGRPTEEYLMVGNLGAALCDRGQFAEALELGQEALRWHREQGDRMSEGNGWGQLGMIHREIGDLDEALRCYERAQACHREVRNRRYLALVYMNKAVLLGDRGDHEGSGEALNAALRMHREVGNLYSAATTLANLGALHRRMGRMAEARAALEEACEIHRRTGNRRYLGYSVAQLADLDRLDGRAELARRGFAEAVDLAEETAFAQLAGWASSRWALLEASEGRRAEALELLDRAEASMRELRMPLLIVETLTSRARVLDQGGDRPAALRVLAQAEAEASDHAGALDLVARTRGDLDRAGRREA